MTEIRVMPDKDQGQLSVSTIVTCALSAWALLAWGWIASFPGTEMSTWANVVGAFLSAPIVVCVVAGAVAVAFEVDPKEKGLYSLKWQDSTAIGVLVVITILLPSIFSHASILLETTQSNLARQLWNFRFWSLPSAISMLGCVALIRECSRP